MGAETKIEAASLHAAMARAFAAIEAAMKDSTNPHFKSKYADLGSVIDAIKPALTGNGLFFTQVMHDATNGVCVETVVHHEGGESLSCGKLFVPASKQDAQGFGSALTYARRYSLMTAFGVPAEDDDGNAAARTTPRADPLPDNRPITDEQRDLIQALAPGAGKTLQEICGGYNVGSLKELTYEKAVKCIARLQELGKAPVQ